MYRLIFGDRISVETSFCSKLCIKVILGSHNYILSMPVQAPIAIQIEEEALINDEKKASSITKSPLQALPPIPPSIGIRKPTQKQYNSIGSLYPGSRFIGEQKSGRNSYCVSVEIQVGMLTFWGLASRVLTA